MRRCPVDGLPLLPTHTADSLVGEVLDQRYELVRVLGAGTSGRVYLARHLPTDRDVAVKVLRPELVAGEEWTAAFKREALTVCRLRHPNTVRVYDFGKTAAGHPYIALELLDGSPLDELILRAGRLRWARAADIAAQICASLSEAHRLGLVHRDLKPANVLLVDYSARPDHVKVLDFGIACNAEAPGANDEGRLVGTPLYMSPEQVCGAGDLDGRADLYSLGVILYEMLAGEVPFYDETPLGVLRMHLEQPVPPLAPLVSSKVPAGLIELTERLLVKNRKSRPGDCGVVRDALLALLPQPKPGRPTAAATPAEPKPPQVFTPARPTEASQAPRGKSAFAPARPTAGKGKEPGSG